VHPAVPPNLVLAFVEDGSLRLYTNAEAAISEWPGPDAESQVAVFYDRRGTYLQPTFTKPNRPSRLFGLVPGVWGTYQLTPNPSAREDPFSLALFEHTHLEPNPWFSSVEALKAFLLGEGVEVEFSHPSTSGET
jgi:hypothetical protein